MKTEELIDSLVHDAKPVRRMPSPVLLAVALIVTGVVSSLAGAWLMGVRPDFGWDVFNRRFIMINSMLVFTLGAAAFVLATMSIPGRQRRQKIQLIFGLAVFTVIVGMFLMRWPWVYGMGWNAWLVAGGWCVGRGVLLGAIPTGVGVWLHSRGAPMNPGVSGGLIGGASATQGANATGWCCDIEEPAHVLLCHFLIPTVILSLIGVWAGRRWLRW